MPDLARFTSADPYGAWDEGVLVEDLGWESDHPDAPPIRLLKVVRTGETLALTDPWGRKLLERVPPPFVLEVAVRRPRRDGGWWWVHRFYSGLPDCPPQWNTGQGAQSFFGQLHALHQQGRA